MGKLLVHQFVSLDGYAADDNGDFSLFEGGEVRTPEFDLELLVRLQLVDAILLGATTYRMFADYWPTPASASQLIAPSINTIEKIVFSSTLESAPWGEFAPARVESGDAVEAIRALKEEKFGDLLVWGSLTLTDALFAAGLVDSVRISVLPVILGSGRSPYPAGYAEREIRLVDSGIFDSSIVASEYAVGHHVPVVTGAIAAPVEAPAETDSVASDSEQVADAERTDAAPAPADADVEQAAPLAEPAAAEAAGPVDDSPPETGSTDDVFASEPVPGETSAEPETSPESEISPESESEPRSAEQFVGPTLSEPWQPPAAQPEYSPGADRDDADQAGTAQPDAATVDAAPIDDAASASNPPQDADESEWLVSRRKWE